MIEQHCIFIFHGSAAQSAKEAAFKLTNSLKRNLDCSFSVCYLREGTPTLSTALNDAYQQGFRNIICMPLLLLPGSHTNTEIPEIIKSFQEKHQDCKVSDLPCLAENNYFVEFIKKVLDSYNG